MNAGTVPEDVKAYLSAVRARLDDLPVDERDDLLADVEPSILDSAEESDAPVELRLGPPESFADELRAAAGLPPRAQPGAAAGPTLRDRYAAWAARPAPRWARELAPLWWVLRGLVAVGLFDLFYDRSALADDDYAVALAVAAALAVIVSVALGLRRPRRNALLAGVNLVLAFAAPVVLVSAVADVRAGLFDGEVMLVMPTEPMAGFAHDGRSIQNVYAFDRQGRLLQDVRLYDQEGRPLNVEGAQDPNRRAVRTRSGELVFNAFPIRYFEPHTRRVAEPAAGAPDRPAPLVTAPLGR
jgi:hypothetical protein